MLKAIRSSAIRALASYPIAAMGRGLLRGYASVFMLHRLRVRPADRYAYSVESLRRFIPLLRASGARFVPLSQLVREVRSGDDIGHSVAFTIDDGFADQAVLARELIALGCPVTVFLITGLLDGDLWPWDDKIAWAFKHCDRESVSIDIDGVPTTYSLRTDHERHWSIEGFRDRVKMRPQADMPQVLERVAVATGVAIPERAPTEHAPMSWQTVRELQQEGVEFGAHSVSHRIFSRLTDDESAWEIAHSLQRVGTETNREARLFAWPTGRTGDFTERDIGFLKSGGVEAAFSTNNNYARLAGLTPHADDLYRLKRFTMPHNLENTLQYGTWIERGKQILRGD